MGVGLLALLAWAWWPSGQYQPVGADERGTLREAVNVSAVRDTAFRPTEGVEPPTAPAMEGGEPQTAYALVPRSGTGPTLLLVRAGDGTLRNILTDGTSRTGVAFPFELPVGPGDGDNQALAVNTGDGTVVYDVAVALVWVTDGAVVDNRNEAYALASCTSCTTVAVAFGGSGLVQRRETSASTATATPSPDSVPSATSSSSTTTAADGSPGSSLSTTTSSSTGSTTSSAADTTIDPTTTTETTTTTATTEPATTTEATTTPE